MFTSIKQVQIGNFNAGVFGRNLPPIIKKNNIGVTQTKICPQKIYLEDENYRIDRDWWTPHCNIYC